MAIQLDEETVAEVPMAIACPELLPTWDTTPMHIACPEFDPMAEPTPMTIV
jgi:hypothetical protein